MKTLRSKISFRMQHLIDRILNVETAIRISGVDLNLPNEECNYYDPVGWLTVVSSFREAKISMDDVLLDVGCGKGRALIAASLFPFKKMIGVDISKILIEQARKNEDRRRRISNYKTVALVAADVCDWAVPDDVNVVFMYNPFSGDVMRSFLSRLTESRERNPRNIKLIYVNPKCDQEVLASGWLEKKHTTTRSLVGRVNFYQSMDMTGAQN